jgi:hypothetical protein
MVEEDEDESPHVNTDETDEEAQDTCPALDNDLDSDVDNVTIEEGDRIFMTMVHPVDPQHFVRASSTVSRRLAEAFANNSKPKDFQDIGQRLCTHTLMSLAKPPLISSQSDANGTMPLSWSANPRQDPVRSIQ